MIRIIVAGTEGSGKSAIAVMIAKMLEGLNAKVTVDDGRDNDGGVKAYTPEIAEAVIRVKNSEVYISTQALNRGASTEQIEKAWISLPAAKVNVPSDERFARSVNDPAITLP